jgi:hypothetical protein
MKQRQLSIRLSLEHNAPVWSPIGGTYANFGDCLS